MSSSTRSPPLVPHNFRLFPKVRMSMKGKCSERILDFKAARTVQVKPLWKADSRAVAGGGEDSETGTV